MLEYLQRIETGAASMNRRKIVILILTLLLLLGGGWFLYATGFFRAVTSLPQLRA